MASTIAKLSPKQVSPEDCSTATIHSLNFPPDPGLHLKETEHLTMDENQTQIMELSPLDQIMVRGIVRLVLCFPVHDSNDRPAVIHTLQKGLDDTVKQMPYLSGVLRERESQRREVEVLFREGDKIELIVKDVGDELPTYQELRNKQMPPSYFKDELLSPMRNMPESSRKLHPVTVAQASFLRGGLFLCVCFHHSVLDGSGFATFLKMLAKNCSSAPHPWSHQVGDDSTERNGLFQNIEPDVNLKDDGFPEYFLKDPNSMVPPEAGGDEHPTTARLFHIRRSDLVKLKTSASASPKDPDDWISTHDALAALIWSSVTRARSRRLDNQAQSKFCLFVNCRPRIQQYVPPDFIGNICVGAQAPLPCTDVLHSGLSVLARRVRAAIKSVDKGYVLGLIKHVKEYQDDLTCIKPGIKSYMGNDINLVSWVTFPVYEMDFGPTLGKPEWFRCPWRTLDGTVKILPEWKEPRPGSSERGFEVNVELREDDMDVLLKDPLWNAFAQEILY